MVTTLKMIPLMEQVMIPFFSQFINDEWAFSANEAHGKATGEMLNEFLRWAEALKPLREK